MKKLEEVIERKITLILFGIIVFSSVLRFYRINYQSLWVDELYSIIPTDPINSFSSVIKWARNDQPPLFFIYIHYFFKVFGYSELIGRVACALIGLISIPAIYFLGKECQSKSAGLFAALITGFNYFHLYYSQELRFYSMTFLFTTLSYLYFIRAFKKKSPVNFVGYTIFTICLLYTHYYGMAVFGSQILAFLCLLLFKRDSKFILYSLLSGISVIVAFVPWMSTVIHDLSQTQPWLKTPTPFFVAEYFYDYTGKDAFTTAIFVVLIFLFVRSMIKKDSAINKPVNLIIMIWIVISYLIPYLRSVIITPMLVNKYTIITLPAWFLLFSISWDKIKNEKWKLALIIMLPLSAIINLAFFKQHYTRLEKDQFREVSEIVIAKNQFHYPVRSELAWHFNFYFRNSKDTVNYLDMNSLPKEQKFWLLQGNLFPEQEEAELKYLSSEFKIIDKHNLNGANAFLMERK